MSSADGPALVVTAGPPERTTPGSEIPAPDDRAGGQ
jgi:hypothetical protein